MHNGMFSFSSSFLCIRNNISIYILNCKRNEKEASNHDQNFIHYLNDFVQLENLFAEYFFFPLSIFSNDEHGCCTFTDVSKLPFDIYNLFSSRWTVYRHYKSVTICSFYQYKEANDEKLVCHAQFIVYMVEKITFFSKLFRFKQRPLHQHVLGGIGKVLTRHS